MAGEEPRQMRVEDVRETGRRVKGNLIDALIFRESKASPFVSRIDGEDDHG